MKCDNNWKDYELIDASCGEKFERWGNIYLLRPDPQIIWNNGSLKDKYYNRIDAIYHRSNKGGGYWENMKNIPGSWKINYNNLTFNIKQMGFKHTGLFPEQAFNWDFMIDKIKKANRNIKVLNLFAYTGGATVACLSAGAHVTHVDSSRGMVDWCKENVADSNCQLDHVRYIVDDVLKFVEREIRRGNKYDAIVMDPPSYGRGSNGEVWDIEKNLDYLVKRCSLLLSDKPLFFIINSYTASLSPTVLYNLLCMYVNNSFQGNVSCDEIGLNITSSGMVLPCGVYARWESYE